MIIRLIVVCYLEAEIYKKTTGNNVDLCRVTDAKEERCLGKGGVGILGRRGPLFSVNGSIGVIYMER